ncbi:hypothetical protein TRAPUB_11829 [Trametes pubescens]|uniref:BTB domain-containing protein n=1 Tax=Trametes pubescens TaxID=154538 RepID=A0A1M2VVU3_TRAPU|nr:hypothetical protein TRAPUB_11829 [Trametes pubescens]
MSEGAPESVSSLSKPDADIILRSSNGVEFRVHKAVLSEASPVFESMFTLPQPSAPPSNPLSPSVPQPTAPIELPVVDMSESSEVLEWLLRLCHPPTDDPDTDYPSLRDIARLIQTARKYDMQQALERAADMLTRPGALDDPLNALRVFAVASDVDVPQAEEAARASLRAPLGKDLPYELDGISAASLYRLLEYRRRVHAAAVDYLTDADIWTLVKDFNLETGSSEPTIIDSSAIFFPLSMCRGDHHSSSSVVSSPRGDSSVPLRLRLDRTMVTHYFVTQVKQIHCAFELHMHRELYEEACESFDCEGCVTEAHEYLDAFAENLQEGVKKVMMRVPLDVS